MFAPAFIFSLTKRGGSDNVVKVLINSKLTEAFLMKRKTVMRAVGNAMRAWHCHMKAITLEVGIPDSYRPVLMYLHKHPGSGQKDIASFAEVTTSAVNQVVKRMLEDDYLRKESDSADKRSTRLFLTDKGNCAIESIKERLIASDKAVTERLGAERETELIELLDGLADYIRRDLGKC